MGVYFRAVLCDGGAERLPAHAGSVGLSERVALVLARQTVHLQGWRSRNGTDCSGLKIFFPWSMFCLCTEAAQDCQEHL